jgi:hypothetical protein
MGHPTYGAISIKTFLSKIPHSFLTPRPLEFFGTCSTCRKGFNLQKERVNFLPNNLIGMALVDNVLTNGTPRLQK